MESTSGGAPATGRRRIAQWRKELSRERDALQAAFFADPDTPKFLREHARLVDRVVTHLWAAAAMPADYALLAVGGYGRAQLYPHSDVDVLVLLPSGADAAGAAAIEAYFASLWDVGLDLAHAVRTIPECEAAMQSDVTVRTSLLENRWLAGARRLHDRLRRSFDAQIDVRAFYAAKMLEQQQRHFKYHDAAYNLEPNVKESPGGLRDLQAIIWIARTAGLGRTWRELAHRGLMTTTEARAVARQERFIGGLRMRLHFLAARREDRLVFDQQAAMPMRVEST
jgi:[protein-PII] uridylyltransferase